MGMIEKGERQVVDFISFIIRPKASTSLSRLIQEVP